MTQQVGKVTLDTRELDRIAAHLGVNVERALASIAEAVQAQAVSRAPVATGALKNSIATEQKSRFLYWVADGVEYGIYQELGTSRMAAQPFMVPAVENVRRQVAKMIGGELTK